MQDKNPQESLQVPLSPQDCNLEESKIFTLKAIKKEWALLLSVEQMRHFGGIVISNKEENPKILNLGLLKELSRQDKEMLKKLLPDFEICFGRISIEDFNRALEVLEVEEKILKLLTQISNELTQENPDESSSVMKLIAVILQEAFNKKASDVHFEKDTKTCRIRMRFDGVLLERFCFKEEFFAPLSSCLKLLAHLDITENTLPQDGRFSFVLKTHQKTPKTLDFRISTLPLLEGESIVLRILDQQKTLIPLEELGFDSLILEDITFLSCLPYGLVFVTGPTGSGKSTTLYGILNQIKEKNLKIITLEDPVEYKIPHISQVAMNHKISFANALRSVLRQDPDVIMVGEIRDKETLQVAISAAFTGHLVFTTLHTNDALDTIVRLLDMGIEPYFIAQSLSGILAQRLVRKLCEFCKTKEGEEYHAKGCEMCNHSGYSGREAITEILLMNRDLEDFIYKKISKEQILEKIRQKNPNFSLKTQALKKVSEGKTDLKEIYRVIR